MSVKVAMVSLGCAKNQVDAERMLYRLYSAGFEILPDIAGAEVVVVNTCGFIDSAKQECIETILEYGELKKENRIKGIVVTGCMAQRYYEEIAADLPEVDCIITPGRNEEICSAVEAAASGKKMTLTAPPEALVLTGERICSTPEGWAYLKIADGCDNRCAYCKIPDIRGRFRSVPMDTVIAEARELCDGGAKELVLIAQDITAYGTDLCGKPQLCELLSKLEEIENLHWIRLLYLYPEKITDALIEKIAGSRKIVPYLDIPVQHASGRVLRAMNRPGDAASLLALFEKLRARIENVTLRTTFMVGFPGEDKAAFGELLDFVKQAKPSRAGCFVFSAQEGTPAAELELPCTPATAMRREKAVMAETARIMGAENLKKIGSVIIVLVEGYDRLAEHWYGRSAADAPEVDGKVFFKGSGVKCGEFVSVRVSDAQDLDLIGEKV